MFITHSSIIELNWPGSARLLTQHMVSLFQITKTTFLWGKGFTESKREEKYRGALFLPLIIPLLKASAKSHSTFLGL